MTMFVSISTLIIYISQLSNWCKHLLHQSLHQEKLLRLNFLQEVLSPLDFSFVLLVLLDMIR